LTCAFSPRFTIELAQGWNRLLIKLSTYNRQGWRSQKFAMRLLDVSPVDYEEENIVWMTELPERANAVPIVVGDRVFTVAEPDELLCLDKRSGRILWRRMNGLYEATSPEYRRAHPVFAEKIDALAQRLPETTDRQESLALRCEIRDLLVNLDKKKYQMKWDGHLADHFGIVGFTTTPVSDGRYVYAFFGQGVIACYDLDGNRKWIKRLEADEIRYSCTPALIGGKLAVVFGGTYGLDAGTGTVLWHQPEITSIASLIPGTVRNIDVVCTRSGHVLRASDGRLLWTNPHIREGDTGWAAPVVIDEVTYLPWVGIGSLLVADFREVTGEPWEPAVRLISVDADHRRPNGEWLDRWTAGSPLIHEGIYYNIDQYGIFYAVDLESGKTLYKHDVGFDELHHYNAIGVGAGPALGGKHIYVVDNQGDCVVLEPGPTYRQVAVNHIQTSIRRHWPIPPQEILSNGAPVFEGGRMYLRGERYLYCIGETQ
jgi:outer membrane protein assembly factor BamB